ncbi:hypothetical protein [Polyangium aurulentum]|uniref:hypothetical protein n=1 Tax=Polyangium aurulentum TaxID=2567896 RepID=UPI0010AECBD2|nr:hypothetical protein [Polyangium aurulentum]UQA56472.1 hypothetical protein E8A73_034930 [Polyangium aurulentum]
MRNIATLILASGLVACGADWNGSYVGTLSTTGTCSDGSEVTPSKSSVNLTLRDDGDTVTWEPDCGATAIADIDGDVANLRQYSCPAETNNGTTAAITVNGGTLTLNDNSLRMDLDGEISLSGAVTGTCDLTIQGTLSRLED